MKDVLKVAGVTFTNDDGLSRQSILKYFGNGCYITVNLNKQSYFNPKTGKSELAIACFEKNTKQQIGFIHREDITADIMNIHQMTGLVSCYEPNGVFYCELALPYAPSNEEYAQIKEICERHNLTMPVYDIRAYKQFSDWLLQQHQSVLL